MIDTFGLAVSHGLIIIAVWRLLSRPDLNDDRAAPPPPSEGGWAKLPRWKDRTDA